MKNIHDLIVNFIQENPINISKLERSIKVIRDGKVCTMPQRTIQNYINKNANTISIKYIIPTLKVLSKLGMTINGKRFEVYYNSVLLISEERIIKKGTAIITQKFDALSLKDLLKRNDFEL